MDPPPDRAAGRHRGHRRLSLIKRAWLLVRQMGLGYVGFRARWELTRRAGLLRRAFPPDHTPSALLPPLPASLEAWRALLPTGDPMPARGSTALPCREPSDKVAASAAWTLEGQLHYFSSQWFETQWPPQWHLNPDTDYTYPLNHWLDIPDLSSRAGDIKYVWEMGRFGYLYHLLADDHHNKRDHSGACLTVILDWIDHNPLNRGPHYRCSQEIALRCLAWTQTLYYYRHHEGLTAEALARIIPSLAGQLDHIWQAIEFSRKGVRNNHALTETLALWALYRLHPYLPEAVSRAAQGRAWFIEEVGYQIAPDGGYLQHSVNYHRVVVQLLTLALSLGRALDEGWPAIVGERAAASLSLLGDLADTNSGWLPNLGHNDGARFFSFYQSHYRDYRPQLLALEAALAAMGGLPGGNRVLGHLAPWPAGDAPHKPAGPLWQEAAWRVGWPLPPAPADAHGVIPGPLSEGPKGPYLAAYPRAGLALARMADVMVMLKGGRPRERPAQADDLHLDLWVGGRNVLLDAGTYKYNTDPATRRAFEGTPAHNTISLGGADQMLRGGRFIWYYWTKVVEPPVARTLADGRIELSGAVRAYGHLIPGGVVHKRKVVWRPGETVWHVTDELSATGGRLMQQHWHPLDGYEGLLSIEARGPSGELLALQELEDGHYSSFYGRRQPMPHLYVSTPGRQIHTVLTLQVPIGAPPAYPDMPLYEV